MGFQHQLQQLTQQDYKCNGGGACGIVTQENCTEINLVTIVAPRTIVLVLERSQGSCEVYMDKNF